MGHNKTFHVEQGKRRHDARAGLAQGLWPLLVIVLAVPAAVSAGEVPTAAGVLPLIPVGEVPAMATDDPPSLSAGSGGAAIRDPFRPVRMSPPGSPAWESNRTGVHPPSSPFSLRRGSTQGTLSLRADDAPVRQVLQALAAQRGMNLVVTQGVEGEITLRLHEMPWRQALALTAGDLQMTRQGQTLVVSQQEAQDDQRQEKAATTLREEGAPLINRLITLQYADATDVVRSIDAQCTSLLSSRGSVRLDKRTNSLVLRDTAAALAAVSDWIAVWDVPLEQVLITAHIVTISRENLREVGVNWRYPGETAPEDARASVKMPVGGHFARIGLPLARLNGRMLELELTALEQENKVDILASPRLYTAHQQTASIKQGTQIPYPMTSGHGKHPSIQFKEAVLCMEVTPRILRNGRITLDLRLSQNVPGSIIKQGESQSVTIDTEEIKTQVTIAEGETIVLGGIFQHQKQRSNDRVPLLADIPLVGALFKRQRANCWFRSRPITDSGRPISDSDSVRSLIFCSAILWRLLASGGMAWHVKR
ncbi:MAG: secretin N-terminal domain-containing protein, partial [Sodalis sp. (in: enterobacteria)]|uniref:secretin N-terminal domain-containing protein n=1 Tax=Sodalis sp. (in: enterobacteria) TaxID=1898979 RepID=UPI0039E23B6E